MFRLLIKLGKWLDKRWPEQVTVSVSDYNALQAKLGALEAKLEEVQRSAVHKEAVQVVIAALQQVKDDLQSFKVSLGMNRMASGEWSDLTADTHLGGQNV